MGAGIEIALYGLLFMVISQKMAKVIALDKGSKELEIGLRILIPVIGLVFVVIGLLVALNIVTALYSTEINYTRAWFFTILGSISIIGSPLFTKIIFSKFSDNRHTQIVGKNGFYVFYIGLGITMLTSGILELTGLM